MTENKTIFNCWSDAVKRFFDINGRATRYEFWAFQSVSLLIFILASLIGFLFDSYKIIFEIYALYFLAPFTTLSVRRLHDVGLSGLWAAPVPILTTAVLFCWETEAEYVILPVFLLMSYMSFLYYVLGGQGCAEDNVYGQKVSEAQIYNQDSMVFMAFMALFLSGLWIIFLARIFF